MSENKRVSQRELGRLTGCVHQNISKLVQRGILEVGKDRKLDLALSLQTLKKLDYVDDNNQFKKPTVPRDKNGKEIYKSFETIPLSDDEILQKKEDYKNEEIQALEDLNQAKKKAENSGIDPKINDDLVEFDYIKSKARKEHYQAELSAIEVKIKTGELVPIVEVEQTFFQMARIVRDMLLNLPNKMAMRVVGKSNIKEIEFMLDEEIRYILQNLSR